METPLSVVIGAIAGAVLSLLWKYFPGLKKWYVGLSGDAKGGINLGLITAVSAGLYGLSAAEILTEGNALFIGDASAAILVWVTALAANQGVYLSFKDVGGKKKSG